MLFSILDSAVNVGNDREPDVITDFTKDRQSASVHTPKSTLAQRPDHPGAESYVPQSPLRASSLIVEHGLGISFFFYRFQNAFGCIRNHGTHRSCILDVQGKVTDQLSRATFSFQSSGICAITSWNLGACT